MMSSVWAKSTSGLRSTSAASGTAARSSARTWRSEPLTARPIGVRTASTITASGMDQRLLGLAHGAESYALRCIASVVGNQTEVGEPAGRTVQHGAAEPDAIGYGHTLDRSRSRRRLGSRRSGNAAG